jgi:hypothetical protein
MNLLHYIHSIRPHNSWVSARRNRSTRGTRSIPAGCLTFPVCKIANNCHRFTFGTGSFGTVFGRQCTRTIVAFKWIGCITLEHDDAFHWRIYALIICIQMLLLRQRYCQVPGQVIFSMQAKFLGNRVSYN